MAQRVKKALYYYLVTMIPTGLTGRGEVVGAISRKDIIGTYHRQMKLLSKANSEDQDN